jgi:hypothetical protein
MGFALPGTRYFSQATKAHSLWRAIIRSDPQFLGLNVAGGTSQCIPLATVRKTLPSVRYPIAQNKPIIKDSPFRIFLFKVSLVFRGRYGLSSSVNFQTLILSSSCRAIQFLLKVIAGCLRITGKVQASALYRLNLLNSILVKFSGIRVPSSTYAP